MNCTGKNEKEFKVEKLISRLIGIKWLADRSCESTDAASEILTLCKDGVTSEVIQKCIDMLDSLSRENIEISAKLKDIENIIEDTASDGNRDDKWAMDEINHVINPPCPCRSGGWDGEGVCKQPCDICDGEK